MNDSKHLKKILFPLALLSILKNRFDIKVQLNILNSLIGSKNIENDFKLLIKKYPEVLPIIPVLLAKREKVIDFLEYNNFKLDFNKKIINDEEADVYFDFFNKSGLAS